MFKTVCEPRKQVRNSPAEVFKQCPCCDSRNLIILDEDVICGKCDWTSCESSVAAGHMDSIFSTKINTEISQFKHGGDDLPLTAPIEFESVKYA